MKNGWQKKSLNEVCQFINGLWKGEKPPFVNIGVFRNTNFTKDGTLDVSDIAYLDVEARKFENRRLAYGDLILEKSGGGPKQPVGRVALFDMKEGEFSFSNFTSVIRVSDPKTLDFRFLHKVLFWTHLSGITETMQSHSTGIRNLNGDAYKSIEIPLPPLPEQRRIVGILDEAFAGIATAKANAGRNLQNARALFESHLQAVFAQPGAEWARAVPLSSVLSVQPRNGWSPPLEYQTGTGVPVLTLSSVTGFEYDGLRIKMSSAPTRADAHYWLEKGELLITRSNTRELVGHVAIYNGTPPRAICCDLIMKMTVDTSKALTRFVYLFLRSAAARKYFTSRAQGASSTMKKIGKRVVQEILVPLPSLQEQGSIVSTLDGLQEETRRLQALYRRKLAALDELKKSLLHRAFSGQL